MKDYNEIEPKLYYNFITPEMAVAQEKGAVEFLYKEICELKELIKSYESGKEVVALKEEICKLRNQNFIRNEFSFSDEEFKKGCAWTTEHWNSVHKDSLGGCGGGSFKWVITPTSIGIAKYVECSCGANFTIQSL